MRYLALDIGERRIGVAISDAEARVASAHSVLDARDIVGDPKPLKRLIEDYEISEIVVGLPLGLDGTEGHQAGVVRETVEKILPHLSLPVTYHDERLSSAEAHRVMSESGMSDRDKRGSVDKVAAAIFLQSFLDMMHARTRKADSANG